MFLGLPIIKDIFGAVSKVADKLIPDKNKREQFKAVLNEKLLELQFKITDIMANETNGNWFQRSWRPLTALIFVFIIVNAKLISPYLRAFFPEIPQFEISPTEWGLYTAFLTSYGIGRSYEKSKKKE